MPNLFGQTRNNDRHFCDKICRKNLCAPHLHWQILTIQLYFMNVKASESGSAEDLILSAKITTESVENTV